MRDQACIVGIGESGYWRAPGSGMSDLQLMLVASLGAIADAGLKPTDIDAIMTPVMAVSSEELAANLGLADMSWSVKSNIGGAAPVASLLAAAMAVSTGVARAVLIPAGLNGYSRMNPKIMAARPDVGSPLPPSVADYYVPVGSTAPPQWYAMMAQLHADRFGASGDALAAVALAMRAHAQLNPKALMRGRPMTIEDYRASPIITTPYRLLDCCLITDAAGAVVVTAPDHPAARAHSKVYISGAAEGHPYPADDISNRADPLTVGLTLAAPRAYAMAGIGPEDADFADTIRREIYAYDYDTGRAIPSGRRLFADDTSIGGMPDGGTVDADGHIWFAVMTRGALVRFAPDGRVSDVIDMPAHPTSVAFGGADLATLYVTTFSQSVNVEVTAPEAGGLFAITGLGVAGIADVAFAD